MKTLIIQIPCFNEEKTLGVTLDALPRSLPGIDRLEWLIVDDGSRDDTVGVATAHGVDHIVRHPRNLGLARAFMTGVEASLARGADIIVNTDADNQYNADDIPALIQPVLDGRADMTVGARPIDDIPHFSPFKKRLQRLGSRFVRLVSGADVADAPSGLRAYSRHAALRLNVFSHYTYTLETLISAGRRGLSVVSVPVRVNPDLRPSRLISSVPNYVMRSSVTILRCCLLYRPAQSFFLLGSLPFLLGVLLGCRYLWLLLIEETTRSHAPSLILAAILLIAGLLLWMLGLIGDLLSINRRLLEDVQAELRAARHAAARSENSE